MSVEKRPSCDLTWYGHATWRLRCGPWTVWIDPFLNDNPSCPLQAEAVEACDVILLTHGHFDHVADAAHLAQRFQATLIANFEIVQWFAAKHGITTGIGMNIGGRTIWQQIAFKMVPAIHSSSLPDGTYGGLAGGYLIEFEGRTLYVAGDTCVFSDMAQLAPSIEGAILPIGDLFTMGPADSIDAIRLIQPKWVVPSHFDTWPPIRQDAQQWQTDVGHQTTARAVLPQIGQPWALD
jgi:L-ascorbate metabolism protein UlaG (beta-lactamase superfamily)